MNTNRWVDDHLAALEEAAGWQPDAARARARLRELDRQARVRRRWAWVAAAAASLGLLTFVQPRACAMPRGCFQSAMEKTATRPVAAPAAAPAVTPAAKPQAAPAARQTSALPNYKESGSVDAPIACEVYSDYECPSCAALYRDIMPLLVADYVQTGKVKLLHRDFPLPQHRYAKLAARYANAAGQAGQYDLAVNRLFQTQAVWSTNGDIEAQLASMLSPEAMRKVRDMVEHDSRLDETVAADQAMGMNDGLHATPTLVIVWKGNRQTISPIPSYTFLKSYLDQLARQ